MQYRHEEAAANTGNDKCPIDTIRQRYLYNDRLPLIVHRSTCIQFPCNTCESGQNLSDTSGINFPRLHITQRQLRVVVPAD